MSDSKRNSDKKEKCKKLPNIKLSIEDSYHLFGLKELDSVEETVDFTMKVSKEFKTALTNLLIDQTHKYSMYERFSFKPSIIERYEDDYFGTTHTTLTVEVFGHKFETDEEVETRLAKAKKHKEFRDKRIAGNKVAKKVKDLKELARLKKLYEDA